MRFEKQLSKYYELEPVITEDKNDVFEIGDSKIKYAAAVGRKSEDELKNIKKEFKKSLTKEEKAYYEKEIEPYLDENHNIINTGKNFDLRIAQRIIFSRVIELGWNPELHLEFDKEIGTGRSRSTYPHERIGKKYQWIAYYEYLAKLSDNFIKYDSWSSRNEKEQPYEGPWEPYVRDIDPTLLISKTGTYNSEEPNEFWWSSKKSFNWNCSNEDWVNDSNELPDFKNLIQVKDSENTEWLILEGYPTWSEPKKIGEEKWYYPQKELWCQIRSYLVHEKDFSRLKEWAIKKDFMGRWMPESVDRYEVYNREYYWSPAYKYFMKEYYGGEEWKEIYDKKTGKLIAPVIVTAENYLWEEEFDNSKEHTISFLKPCVNIFRGMDLKFSDKEGEFINNSNEVNCFATNVYNNSKQHLLVKKKPFVKYLKANNLKILWTVLGEKQIIGGRTLDDDYIGRLEYSGAYYFENVKLKGSFNTKNS